MSAAAARRASYESKRDKRPCDLSFNDVALTFSGSVGFTSFVRVILASGLIVIMVSQVSQLPRSQFWLGRSKIGSHLKHVTSFLDVGLSVAIFIYLEFFLVTESLKIWSIVIWPSL